MHLDFGTGIFRYIHFRKKIPVPKSRPKKLWILGSGFCPLDPVHTAIRPTLDKVINRYSMEAVNMSSVRDFLVELKQTKSCCTHALYYNRMVEEEKLKKHRDNLDLDENSSFYAFIIDMSGRIGTQGKAFINKIKAVSKCSDNCKYKD